MELTTCEWEWFVPAFAGNREAEVPMAIELRRPTLGWIYRTFEALEADPAIAALPPLERAKHVMADARLFLGCTRGVRGVTLRGAPVLTGEALWAAREELDAKYGPLFREIVTAIQARLELDDVTKKNSPSQSGSPPSHPAIAGTAVPVGGPVST